MKNTWKYFLFILLAFVGLNAASAVAQEAPIVWGVKVSPYVRKVLMTMDVKGINYELKETLPVKLLRALHQEVPVELMEGSPLGKIPLFQEKDFNLADSSVIIAYLEKMYPQSSLYPACPKQFGYALWFEKYADTEMSEVIHNKIFLECVVKPLVLRSATDETIVQQAIQEQLPKIFSYLEEHLAAQKGMFLVGNELSIADIAVGNQLMSLSLSKIAIDAKKWPSLSRYYLRLLKQEPFNKFALELIKS